MRDSSARPRHGKAGESLRCCIASFILVPSLDAELDNVRGQAVSPGAAAPDESTAPRFLRQFSSHVHKASAIRSVELACRAFQLL